jgi:ankyrin repeat protein
MRTNERLLNACTLGNFTEVENLFKRFIFKPNVNARSDPEKYTALHLASRWGYTKIVELLLDKHADVKAKDWNGMTPIYSAISNAREVPRIVELLINKGIDVNTKEENGCNPLFLASSAGHRDIAELLINKGADVNPKENHKFTALHEASLCGHKEIVELLINRGADVNFQDHNGRTALYTAIMYSHKEIVELLISNGADVNIQDDYGNTALYIASTKKGYKEIVELLISKGADSSLLHKNEKVEDIVNKLRNNPPKKEILFIVLFGDRPLTGQVAEGESDIMSFSHHNKAVDFINEYKRYYQTTEPLSVLAIGQIHELWEFLHRKAYDKKYNPPYGLLINFNYSGQHYIRYSQEEVKKEGFSSLTNRVIAHIEYLVGT